MANAIIEGKEGQMGAAAAEEKENEASGPGSRRINPIEELTAKRGILNMAFTAKDVATLRAKTGCGMMDCKKALSQADGDMDKAIDFLREKGLAAATKKAGRIAAEGIAYAAANDAGNAGVVIEVNAETDFVAKNAEFRNFVKTCADTVLASNPADVDALLQCKAVGSDETIDAILKEKILKIGENIKIRRFQKFEGAVGAYIHAEGKIGVLAKFDTTPEIAAKPEFQGVCKGRLHADRRNHSAVS